MITFIRRALCMLAAVFLWIFSIVQFSACIVGLAGGNINQSLGEALFAYVPQWLNLSQAIIQRYFFPFFWDQVIVQTLTRPIWLNILVAFAVAIAGLLLWYAAFARKRNMLFY